MADKICPILMAGTMISNIYAIDAKGTKDTHLYYESVRCMEEKCEWFGNGCPAHPFSLIEDGTSIEARVQRFLSNKGGGK